MPRSDGRDAGRPGKRDRRRPLPRAALNDKKPAGVAGWFVAVAWSELVAGARNQRFLRLVEQDVPKAAAGGGRHVRCRIVACRA